MPVSSLQHASAARNIPQTNVAIIGGGLGALMMVAVLRFRGVPCREIAVYADRGAPEDRWEETVRAFRLTHLRSESLGHFYPTDSPGLASVEACQTWSPKPLILSWFDSYHPTVDFFLSHTRAVTKLVGYNQLLVKARVGSIVKNDGYFTLYHTAGEAVGRAQHIVLAVGHGKPILPPPVEAYRQHYGQDQLVVHCFEEKDYAPPRRVLMVGDGLTSGTECANALLAGSTVSVITRQGKYLEQALNTPRQYFSRRGLKPFHEQSVPERLKELKTATRGTIRPYHRWMKLFKDAEHSGQLTYLSGELTALSQLSPTTVSAVIRGADGHALRPIVADQVIVATGFMPASTHPLLQQLITAYQLKMVENYIAIRDDFCIDELSTPQAVAAVIGPAAAWAIPSADSLGGMKIVAHQVADVVVGPESWRLGDIAHKLRLWVRLVAGKELV